MASLSSTETTSAYSINEWHPSTELYGSTTDADI
jgi:hypothetical protein